MIKKRRFSYRDTERSSHVRTRKRLEGSSYQSPNTGAARRQHGTDPPPAPQEPILLTPQFRTSGLLNCEEYTMFVITCFRSPGNQEGIASSELHK